MNETKNESTNEASLRLAYPCCNCLDCSRNTTRKNVYNWWPTIITIFHNTMLRRTTQSAVDSYRTSPVEMDEESMYDDMLMKTKSMYYVYYYYLWTD